MEFIGTESGFKDGLGGASNSASTADYHYILFGPQTDEQHPEYGGIYFEFDSQVNGSVNCVVKIEIRNDVVDFELKDGKKIIVRRDLEKLQWNEFLRGIYYVFGEDLIQKG